MDKRSKKYFYVGYDYHHRGYMLYSTSSRVVLVLRDVEFNKIPEESTSYEDLDDLDEYSSAPN